MAFRTQHRTLADKRRALAAAFHRDNWQREHGDETAHNGIAGGYGQFGVLTNEEFHSILKVTGKRVQKFTEEVNQHKSLFNKSKIPRKDDGVSIIIDSI